MADSNLKRGEPQHFHDNDPFAELTRIMAREPGANEAEAADPFGIDLEKELLGDLEAPFGEQDEFAEAEAFLEEVTAPAEDAALAGDYSENYSEVAAETRPVTAEPELRDEAPAAGSEIVPEAFDHAFATDFDGPERQENDAGTMPDQVREPAAQVDGWERGPVFETTEDAVASQPVVDELGLADVDMDFGELDVTEMEEDAAEFGEAVDAEPVGYAPAEPAHSAPEAEDAVAEWEPAAQDELTLEDELGMLLADGGARQADAVPVSESADAEEWRYEQLAAEATPHIPLYGRANFQPEDEGSEPELEHREPESLDVPQSVDAEDRWANEPAWDEIEPQAETACGEEHVDEVAADSEAAAEAAYAGPAAEEEWTPEPQREPFAVFSTIAPVPQQPQATAAQPFDAAEEFETIEVPEAAMPLQDDLDLPEPDIGDEPLLAFDDYDVEFAQVFGDVADEPAPAAKIENQAEQESDDHFFAETLGFGTAAAGAAAAAEGYPAQSWQDAERAYAPYDDEQLHRADDLEREIDVAKYGEAAAAPAARSRTGMYVAAAVVAVAVLGGIGVFALSSGGDAGNAPVLVQADNEPLKVKPENPGGTSVPNQDSKAYERVAGNAAEAQPTQERLVTTTEEPVNLVARAQSERAEEENALPGVDEDMTALGEAEVEMAAKSEERIETPRQEASGVGAAEDLAAVQPRRVRTMIVRPDGTLVPRENPAPSEPAPSNVGPVANAGPVTSQESLLQPAAASVAEPAARTIREVSNQAQTERAASEAPAQQAQQPARTAASASAEVATPSSGPIIPQRPAEQPLESQTRPAQQQPQQQVAQAAAPARTQPAAPQPQAAASEWSMQIASQPTADSAQATYQDLARRYGNIIGGHGVNIVRADIPGKGTYYRVRIPSSTRSEAISLCEKYKAAGGSCFVSK